MNNLLQNIKLAISKESKIVDPQFDIHYDESNNVIGYVASSSFEKLSDAESQKLIWNAIRNYISDSERVRILMILHETLRERAERISGESGSEDSNILNLYFHEAPDMTRYFGFIAAKQFEADSKSLSLLIVSSIFKHSIIKSEAKTFVYDKEIKKFMEISDEEACALALSNAYNDIKNLVKMDLMDKYFKQNANGIFGTNNPFYYVFDGFKLKYADILKISLMPYEIAAFERYKEELLKYPELELVLKKIAISKMIKIENMP